MKTKQISAQDYNDLPRKDKRELERSLAKQGLETPEIRERVRLVSSVDKEIYLKALKALERSGIDVDRFLDMAFGQLIISEK